MSDKWDDELIKKFLTLYRKHKCLWNPYSPNYRNCTDKNEAFKTVVRELNVPRIRIPDCLEQIEVIREKYKQEQLKAERELTSGKLYTPKIPWFNLMSQMLCDVINDEENFSQDPVTYLPCKIANDEQNEDTWTAIAFGGSPNFQYKPDRYGSKPNQNNPQSYSTSEEKLDHVDSDWRKPPNKQFRVDKSQREAKRVNDAIDPWNRCPSCGWETEKIQEKCNSVKNQINNCEKTGIQIDPGVQVPLRIKRTQILNTNSRMEEVNRAAPPPLWIDESNYLNLKIGIPEAEVMGDGKRVQISPGIVPLREGRGEYISTQSNQCNVTEDRTSSHRDDSEARKLQEVITLEGSNVRYPQSTNENERNVVVCPCRIDDSEQSQVPKNQLSHFEESRTDHRVNEPIAELVLYKDTSTRQSQKISEFKERTLHDPRIDKQLGENRKKFTTTSEEDRYEVCSRFKIVIPSSNRDNQNLKISGFEIRTIRPQPSEYILCPSSGTNKRAIGNADCSCKNELAVSSRDANVHSARYGSIIKLDINHERPRKSHAEKRSCTSSTTSTEEEAADEPKKDRFSEIEVQRKSFSNKETQTDDDYENESMQTLGNMQSSKFNSSKTLRDQSCGANVSSQIGSSCQATTLNVDENSAVQLKSFLNDDSVASESARIENSLVPAENFNHTRIFLNVIVKILESDDTHDRSEDLKTTLDTMLDRFQKMSMTPQNAVKYHSRDDSNNATKNDTSLSTEYCRLAQESAPAGRRAEDINPRKTDSKTVQLDDTPKDLSSGIVDLGDTTYFGPESPIRGGRENDAVNEQLADENKRNSGLSNERNVSSVTEKSMRSGRPASLVAETNASNFTADSFLDNVDRSSKEEPIASSSRRIREHRSPSEILKDFFEVIKYTMTMDGLPQPVENGNKDCCDKTKHNS